MGFGRNRKSKFGSTRVRSDDGYTFASKLEASVYKILKMRKLSGEIEVTQNQSNIHLTDAKILYIPDFKCLYKKSNETFWVEAKGFETAEWRIKRRLWKAYGPGKLEIWMGSHLKPFLKEILIPKV
jgi:hypothetical protein